MSDIEEIRAALKAAIRLNDLVRDLCGTVDAEHEDIGTGPRTSLVILREIGSTILPNGKSFAAALAALEAGGVEGWQLVPVEPTEEMHHAARDWSYAKYGKPIGKDASLGCWAAMLAAAPQPEKE